ncbi:hypothetical protein T265_12359 [Opisthorchis viverrini]|uniref:Uncharacterized protein n=1 Tax=Opisthorchis viverrini TaxID=6198 RepID=A0A074YY81_OPIVI|nr:hypothetical protein T265_12359 [Opisthorchis viverrini]KER18142.1 hypothetical protein T265_12359 [Opisthorchis viverrini]
MRGRFGHHSGALQHGYVSGAGFKYYRRVLIILGNTPVSSVIPARAMGGSTSHLEEYQFPAFGKKDNPPFECIPFVGNFS